MRKADIFVLFILVNLALFSLMGLHARTETRADFARMRQLRHATANLRLTDLCLFTEAGYTRHPSQSDGHMPFQNHPLALEHFPSGSLVMPPEGLRKPHAPLD
jgi:hypothetical protein